VASFIAPGARRRRIPRRRRRGLARATAELGASCARTLAALDRGFLLAEAFRGGRLLPVEEIAVVRNPSLQVFRSATMATDLTLEARPFAEQLRTLVEGFRAVTVAEFLITAIDVDREKGLASTEVRYDIAGPGREAWRVERSGRWRMRWRRGGDGWRVTEWTATASAGSASAPVFTESRRHPGRNGVRRQLTTGLDAWMGTIDSALTRDSNGHHGVSVGDADGDGLEDLYISQPSGLPNRLFRARGDGTFEDATERSGLGVLDDTSQSLFADVDNDGDQDLILSTSAGPVLFLNDGTGRFTRVPDAFGFEKGLQGLPMSMAMADYDRDGFLDLYLCVYSFSYGAGEGKAGTHALLRRAERSASVLFTTTAGHFARSRTSELDVDGAPLYCRRLGDWRRPGGPTCSGQRLRTEEPPNQKGLHGRVVRRSRQGGIEDYGGDEAVARLRQRQPPRLYAGNMGVTGRRVTAAPAFMPDAPAGGPPRTDGTLRQPLLHSRGDGTFEGGPSGRRGDGALGLVVDAGLRQRRMGGPLRRERDVDSESGPWTEFFSEVVARSLTLSPDAVRRRLAGHQPLLVRSSPATSATCSAQRRPGWVRRHLRNGGLGLDQDGRSFAVSTSTDELRRRGDSAVPRPHPIAFSRNDFKDRGVRGRARSAARNRDHAARDDPDQALRGPEIAGRLRLPLQHSKELLFGLGAGAWSRWGQWPAASGSSPTSPEPSAVIERRPAPCRAVSRGAYAGEVAAPEPVPPPLGAGSAGRFPAPDFSLPTLAGSSGPSRRCGAGPPSSFSGRRRPPHRARPCGRSAREARPLPGPGSAALP
jgi:hypothetical protein